MRLNWNFETARTTPVSALAVSLSLHNHNHFLIFFSFKLEKNACVCFVEGKTKSVAPHFTFALCAISICDVFSRLFNAHCQSIFTDDGSIYEK